MDGSVPRDAEGRVGRQSASPRLHRLRVRLSHRAAPRRQRLRQRRERRPRAPAALERRASQNEPLHFTGLSSIAATFNFQTTAGMTPPLGGLVGGFHLSPLFSTVFAENPTFSIVPIEGEEFTKRLLTPFPEKILTLLLRQNADVDLVLRMMAADFRTETGAKKVIYANKPSDEN